MWHQYDRHIYGQCSPSFGRNTDRQTCSLTDRQKMQSVIFGERKIDRRKDVEHDRKTDKQTDRYKTRQTDARRMQSDILVERQTD